MKHKMTRISCDECGIMLELPEVTAAGIEDGIARHGWSTVGKKDLCAWCSKHSD